MKIFGRIINGAVWTVVGLYVLIITLIHIPAIQNYIGNQLASALSDKLGTKVYVGRIDLGFLNRIIIDDVLLYDQQQQEMVKSARIAVKIDFSSLLENRISISSAQIFGTHVRLYQVSKDKQTNFQFVIDSLSSNDKNKEKTPLDLRINSFIMQHSSVSFDRYDAPPTNLKLNPLHLRITDISAHLSLKALKEDSLNVIVKKLAFKEQSGLQIDKLAFKAEGNRSNGKMHDFHLKMPDTDITAEGITVTYMLNENGFAPKSLKYNGGIKATKITPSDLASLVPSLKSFRHAISLSAEFSGTDTEIQIPKLNVASPHNEIAISAMGWIRNWNANPRWALSVNGFDISADMAGNICRVLKSDKSGVLALIARAGQMSIKGTADSDGYATKAQCRLKSQQIGEISLDCRLLEDNNFTGNIHTSGISFRQLLGNDKFGFIATDISVRGKMPENGKISVTVAGTVPTFEYNGYKYKNIAVHGTFDDRSIAGSLKVNDPNIVLNAEGILDKTSKASDIKLKAAVRDFSPTETRLTDKWGKARFCADINADFKAADMNDVAGFLSVTNFSMSSPEDIYSLERLEINSGYNEDDTHYIKLDSDFGTAEILGNFAYSTLAQSVINAVKKKLPTIRGQKSTNKALKNNFKVNATIHNTEWIERLFHVPLHIEGKAMMLQGEVNDWHQELSVNCDIPYFKYNGKEYRYGEIEVTSFKDTLRSCIGVTKVMDNGDSLELRAVGSAADNNVSTSFAWDNNARKRMSGVFNAKTRFFMGNDETAVAQIEIQPSHINMNNSTWDVKPSTITYMNNNVKVDRFSITNNEQHIIVNGTASDNARDSLSIDLKDIDIEYILDLINFHSVNFNGKASGRAYLSAPFGDMSADGLITVNDFKFENGRMGVLDAKVDWDKEEKQININAIAADGQDATTTIYGYVSPSRNYMDLGIRADGTHIDFMQSFTGSFLRDINGQATGQVVLAGPLNSINLAGELVVNGEATVKPTNCKYFLRNDTVTFVPDEIQLRDMPFYDIHNSKATLSGTIRHKHLTNLSYDLSVRAENLLAYDFKDFGDDTFYGTVYGSGNVDIHGRSGELNIDIDITPRKNSSFVYNVSNPDAISGQEFIQWHDATPTATKQQPATARKGSATVDIPTDTHINFLINCTPDVTVKVLMDSRTNDYITLNGNGTIRATYYNKGAFNMFGTYIVERGTYGITIQDIMKKNFVFNEGGKIVFGGNPYNASLDLQAIHTVNGVSLSDLNIGNSFSNNTIRVNCLMNIGGQPLAPQVTFDLDMPTVSSDEKQMIRSIINSEDEMNQQVVYLLGIGRFYPQEANNATLQNEKQQSQASLAMQSLSSGIISSQINSVLNTVINTNNWNFGANISTGDEGWNNAEYEGLLSGRLLNNRLLINGQFGYRDNVNNSSTSFIGDFDIRYLLYPNGNLAINIYNKTNDRYFTKSSLNTQGIGLIMKKDFNGLKDLFNANSKRRKKRK